MATQPDRGPNDFHAGRSGWFSGDSLSEEVTNEQLISVLARIHGEEPLILVIDEMEAASAVDLAMLESLLKLSNLGSGFRLILAGRSAARFLALAAGHTHLRVPPLDDSEMSAQCESLFEDLNMPAEIESHLYDMCKGFPFALEEALIRLVRHKALRRVYGNYFFSGMPNAQVGASARLTRHLESENLRLESPLCVRILSHAEVSFFADQVTSVATALGQSPGHQWELPYVESGLIEQVPSAMGDSLSMTCPLYGLALAKTVTEASSDVLKHLVGREIAASGDDTSDHWKVYELLAGTPDATPVLIQAARAARSTDDRLRAFHALVDELHAHHERMGDPETELAMLWVLLPLARRLGKLGQLRQAVDRAVELAEGQPDKMIALSALRADFEQNEGRLREAELLLLQGLSLAHANDDRRKAVLFVQLGKVLHRQGRHPEARKLFEDVLEVLERTGGTALAATCQFHLGNIALQEGRFETAIDMHEEALKERRRRKLTHQVGASLSALGAIHLALGDYPRSLLYYRDAEDILEQYGREGEVSFALQGLGRALSRLGDYQDAASVFKRSLQLRQSRDDRTGEAIARLLVADNFLSLEQNELALEEARKAHFALSLGESTVHLGDAEQLLGRIRLKQRHFEDSRQHLDAAINIHQQHGDIMAATFDRAWLLETSIAVSDHRRIEELCSGLEAVLETLRYPELGETLDLRLYHGLEWLRQRGRQVDPLKALRRGYRELYRKTELLSADLRNAFLFQIPDNRAIVNAATLHGLTLD
jgi:tetratricopeptide (TPR) repeat protein